MAITVGGNGIGSFQGKVSLLYTSRIASVNNLSVWFASPLHDHSWWQRRSSRGSQLKILDDVSPALFESQQKDRIDKIYMMKLFL